MAAVKKENGFNRLPLRAQINRWNGFPGRWQRLSPG